MGDMTTFQIIIFIAIPAALVIGIIMNMNSKGNNQGSSSNNDKNNNNNTPQ